MRFAIACPRPLLMLILFAVTLFLLFCSNVVVADTTRKAYHFILHKQTGLYHASNRGEKGHWDEIFKVLERWRNIEGDKEGLRFKSWNQKVETIAFSYIDEYSGQLVVTEGDLPNSVHGIWQSVPREILIPLDDKWTFAQAVQKAGLEGKYTPRTFANITDVLQNYNFPTPRDNIFFVKDRFGTAGEGIAVKTLEELRRMKSLPAWHVVQEGITDELALYRGGKITMRWFFLCMRGALYLPHAGWFTYKDRLFNAESTNTTDHLILADYKTMSMDVLHRPPLEVPFHDPGFKFLDERHATTVNISEVVNSNLWKDAFLDMGRKFAPTVLRPILEYTANSPNTFAWFGIDILPLKDGSLRILEMNMMPSFSHFNVIADIILLAMGMEGEEDPQLKERMVKVWDIVLDNNATGDHGEHNRKAATTATKPDQAKERKDEL